MSCMLRGDRVVSHDLLIRTTGLNFSEACYMHLSTAAAFAKKKYANKNGSNGTSLPLKWLIQQVKKGSKRYRTLIDRYKNDGHDISNLRVVKTFFELLDCPVPEKNRIQAIHGSWNWSFLGNRIRTFCFQFFNNSLSVGARLNARYRAGGIVIDDRCSFCVKSGINAPGRETFTHLFYDCPQLISIRNLVLRTYISNTDDERKKKLLIVAGCSGPVPANQNFLILLTSIFYNFTIWQWKLKKIIPSVTTVFFEIDNHFDNAVTCSNFIKNLATESVVPICRRWRERNDRRG
jgi:hypothetical protein